MDASGQIPVTASRCHRPRPPGWRPGRRTGVWPGYFCAGSRSRASRSATRRSWNRRLDRAAFSRSSRVRVSAVSCRTRCLRVVFSVVMRCDGFLGPLGLQVADLAQELADAVTLPDDLGVRGLKRVLGVERPFPPGRLLPGVVAGQVLRRASPGAGHGAGQQCPGLGVGVEEGPGDTGPAGDARRRTPGPSPAASGPGRRGRARAQPGRRAGGPPTLRRCARHRRRSRVRPCILTVLVIAGVVLIVVVLAVPSSAAARSEARKAVLQTRWK